MNILPDWYIERKKFKSLVIKIIAGLAVIFFMLLLIVRAVAWTNSVTLAKISEADSQLALQSLTDAVDSKAVLDEKLLRLERAKAVYESAEAMAGNDSLLLSAIRPPSFIHLKKISAVFEDEGELIKIEGQTGSMEEVNSFVAALKEGFDKTTFDVELTLLGINEEGRYEFGIEISGR